MKILSTKQTRNGLTKVFKGVGVEVGVEQGVFSEVICKNKKVTKLYSIDPWKAYRGYRDHVRQEKLNKFYEITKKRLKPYNSEIIRKFSVDAAEDFADESLDFVYIDANHDYKHVYEDLTIWSKKVKIGGLVAGHDYIKRKGQDNVYGVVAAVNDFVKENKVNTLKIYRGDNSPSWMYLKSAKIAILTANLGNFDKPIDPIKQELPDGIVDVKFHRYTDVNFPPITGLTSRFQYRIPKLFGWQMFPGYDYYVWLDGSMTFQRKDSLKWFFDKIKGYDIVLFKHPWRNTSKEEADLISKELSLNKRYIVSRYNNGLHKEQLSECLTDPGFKDNILYTSTAFIYRNNKKVRDAMKLWWYHQSRYFTCDQIVLPYIMYKSKLKVNVINEDQYNIPYLTLVNKHK